VDSAGWAIYRRPGPRVRSESLRMGARSIIHHPCEAGVLQ